jgi:ASCH domain-containing protein
MQFSPDLRPLVLSGDITVSVRLWSRPKVRAGGRYPVADGEFEVDSVELMPFSVIDDEDVRRSGEASREALRQRAAHAGPIDEDTLVYRVELHVVDGATTGAEAPNG